MKTRDLREKISEEDALGSALPPATRHEVTPDTGKARAPHHSRRCPQHPRGGAFGNLHPALPSGPPSQAAADQWGCGWDTVEYRQAKRQMNRLESEHGGHLQQADRLAERARSYRPGALGSDFTPVNRLKEEAALKRAAQAPQFPFRAGYVGAVGRSVHRPHPLRRRHQRPELLHRPAAVHRPRRRHRHTSHVRMGKWRRPDVARCQRPE